MVSLTELAYNQLQSIISQYGAYRNVGEFGRSAFWLWHDQIVNATRKVNVSESKKVSSTLYCYTIPYWGVIYFTYIRVRKNGRFNGIHIIVKEYNFDVENFYRWLKHEELIPIQQQIHRTINKRFKPRNAGFGFRVVRSTDGFYNYINIRNELLSPTQWFKEVKPFKNTKQGILAFVNNNGICNAIDSNGTIYDMNRAWKDCFTEGKIKKDIMTEAINKISQAKRTIRLTEAELKGIIVESVKQVLTTTPRKIGNWDCIPSNGYEFYEIPNKGKCVGIAMYVDNTTNVKIPPTYCLFRRGSNGKYFYATIVDAPEKGSIETKFLTVPVSDVPQEIYLDRYNLNLLS